MSSCDIVVPIWNQRERTQRCLESVLKNTEPPCRLILIDNASQPETRDWLARFSKESPVPVHLIRNEQNLGFIKGVNQGIRAAQSPWICLLNNDTIVTPGWLKEMIAIAQSDPKIGLINPSSNSLGVQTGGKPLDQFAQELKSQSGRSEELSTALGFCLLASRNFYDKVGLLDEAYGMGNFDDDDLSRRARQAGFRCVRARAAYVYHEEKVSFKELPGWEKDFDRNREIFQKRWGKPLRILWALSGVATDEARACLDRAVELARQGNWVDLFEPASLRLPKTSQGQIKQFKVRIFGWRGRVLLQLLQRRKKPYDLIISHDFPLSRWVTLLGKSHRAKLLHAPTQDQVQRKCQALSRSQ